MPLLDPCGRRSSTTEKASSRMRLALNSHPILSQNMEEQRRHREDLGISMDSAPKLEGQRARVPRDDCRELGTKDDSQRCSASLPMNNQWMGIGQATERCSFTILSWRLCRLEGLKPAVRWHKNKVILLPPGGAWYGPPFACTHSTQAASQRRSGRTCSGNIQCGHFLRPHCCVCNLASFSALQLAKPFKHPSNPSTQSTQALKGSKESECAEKEAPQPANGP